MNRNKVEIPKFKNASQEAGWWASKPGRDYVKQRSASAKLEGIETKGSRLIAKLNIAKLNKVAKFNKKSNVQIAIRLPEQGLDHARQIAERKGIGYQTLLRMLVQAASRLRRLFHFFRYLQDSATPH